MASRSRRARRRPVRASLAEPPGFESLTKAEQVRYLQDLWDRVSDQTSELPLPDSHLLLAKERLAEYRRSPARTRPARDVIHRLINRHR